jgi:tetratricopeptide (TPR) repeat protein
MFAGRDQVPSEFRPADVRIQLGRLKRGRLNELVSEFLGATKIADNLLELVHSTSEGNPLYVDEVIRTLKQSRRIQVEDGVATLVGDRGDVELPVNLEGMISSRIDALGPAAKGVLQIAATVGVTFNVALVREASGLDDIGGLLTDLIDRGIIERSTPSQGGVAGFSSILLWEAVHRSILGVRLSEYHRMVADGMERLFGDELDNLRMELAAHCAAGGQYLRAAGHADRAGDRLRAQQMLAPALDCWEEGIGWLDHISRPGHATRVKEALLRLKAGDSWRLAGDPRKAEIHLQVAQDLGEDVGDAEIESRATVALGHLYKYMGRSILGRASYESARALAIGVVGEDGLDSASAWRREVAVDALNGLGSLALEQGEMKLGQSLLHDAKRIAGSDDLLSARTLATLAMRDIRNGDYDIAMEQLEEARHRAERAGDPLLLGRILNNLGTIHSDADRFDKALEFYQAALKIREGLDYRMGAVINLHNIGDVHFRTGDDARAWAAFKRSHDLASASGFDHGVIMNEAYMAFLDGQRGADDTESRLVEIAGRADKFAHSETRVNARLLLGKHLLADGNTERAREIWQEGVKVALDLGAPQLARPLEASLADL